MPMPTIDGRQVKWICEFCYTMLFTDPLPASWDWIYQSAVCPECRERVARDGGYHVVVAGAYAEGPDPRSVPTPARPTGGTYTITDHRGRTSRPIPFDVQIDLDPGDPASVARWDALFDPEDPAPALPAP